LDSVTRVTKALSVEIPDRVPLGEFAISDAIIGRILNIEPARITYGDRVRGFAKLGLDLVTLLDWGARPGKNRQMSEGSWVNEWNMIMKTDKPTDTDWWVGTRFNSVEDWEQFEMPPAVSDERLETFKKAINEGKGKIAVAGLVWGPQHYGHVLLGVDKLLTSLYTHPKLLKKMLSDVNKWWIEWGKALIDLGVDAMWVGDDLGETKGLLMSPKHFREFELPLIREQIDTFRKKHVPVIFHSDGNITQIIGDVVQAGINALHPIQPNAMDLPGVKAAWGQKICVMGNLDSTLVLPGSRDKLIEETKKCIRTAAPGGGYIMASGNSILANTPLENIQTWVETTKKYGTYPIRI